MTQNEDTRIIHVSTKVHKRLVDLKYFSKKKYASFSDVILDLTNRPTRKLKVKLKPAPEPVVEVKPDPQETLC